MAFEISNYYEQAVINTVTERYANDESMSHDVLEDIACVALNHLPAKYVRHAVDLAFYMDSQERAAVAERLQKAVDQAYEYVSQHRR